MKATSLRATPVLQSWVPGTSGVQVSVLGGGCDSPMVKGSFLPQAMPTPPGASAAIRILQNLTVITMFSPLSSPARLKTGKLGRGRRRNLPEAAHLGTGSGAQLSPPFACFVS